MGDAGLFAIPFPQDVGGAGLEHPVLATMVMLEEVSYVSSGLSAAMVDVQLILFGHTLQHASTAVFTTLLSCQPTSPGTTGRTIAEEPVWPSVVRFLAPNLNWIRLHTCH